MLKISGGLQKVLFVIIALLPILFIPGSIISLEPLKIFIALFSGTVFAAIFLSLKISSDSLKVTRNPLVIACFGVVLSAGLATFFSDNIDLSLFGRQISHLSFMGLISLFAFAYAVYLSLKDSQSKTRFFLWMYSSSILVCVVHLLFILLPVLPSLGFFYEGTSNTLGTWGEVGFFALFTALTSIVVLRFLGSIPLYRIMGLVGFVSGTLLLLVVGYPVLLSLAALCAGLIVILDAVLGNKSDHERRKTSIVAVVLLALSVMFIFFGGMITPVVNSLLGLDAQEVRPSLVGTYEVTQSTIEDSFFFGQGLDRFDVSWLKNQPQENVLSQYWDTDFRSGYSTVTSVGVTQGVVGMIAWIIFIALIIYYSYKLLKVKTTARAELFMNIYAVFGTLFFLGIRIVYNPSIVLTLFFFIFLGLLFSSLRAADLLKVKKNELEKYESSTRLVYTGVLVLSLIAILYTGYVQVSQYSSRVIFDNAVQDFYETGDMEGLQKNTNLSRKFFNSDIYGRLAVEIGILAINQTAQNSQITQEQITNQISVILEQAQKDATGVLTFDSQSYRNHLTLLELYKGLMALGVEGAEQEARRIIESSFKLTPENPRLYLEKARLAVLGQDLDGALVDIEQALNVKSNYVAALVLRAQILNDQGDIQGSIEDLIVALQIDPQNQDLYMQLGATYYAQEDYSNAVSVLERLAQGAPNFLDGIYLFGLSLYRAGESDRAVEVFESLQSKVPENSEVSEVLSRMESGESLIGEITPPLDEAEEDPVLLENDLQEDESQGEEFLEETE